MLIAITTACYTCIYICLNYICTFCYVIEFAQVRLADQMFMVNNSVAQLATIEAALDAFDKWQLLNLTVCIIKPFISIYIHMCEPEKDICIYIDIHISIYNVYIYVELKNFIPRLIYIYIYVNNTNLHTSTLYIYNTHVI